MIQVNLFTKQKEIHRHRKWIYGYQRGNGMWEGQITSLELANANYYIQNRQTTVYITRNYIQYIKINCNGKKRKPFSVPPGKKARELASDSSKQSRKPKQLWYSI